MKIRVTDEVFQKYPNLSFFVIVAKGLNNHTQKARVILDESKKATEKIRERLQNRDWEKESDYKAGIDLYLDILNNSESNLEKSKVVPSSISLTRKIMKGDAMPNINPLVNLYNMHSVRSGLAFGGEDLSKIVGDLKLDFAQGFEKALLIGDQKEDVVGKGELIWSDGFSVTCRMLGWRQSERTKITNSTTDAYFVIDIYKHLDDREYVDVCQSVENFVTDLKVYLSCETKVYSINIDSPCIDIEYDTAEVGSLKDMASSKDSQVVTKGTKGLTKRKADSMGFKDSKHFTNKVSQAVSNALWKDNEFEIELNVSANPEMGDLSSSFAMKVAKEKKQNPKDIALSLVESIKSQNELNKIFENVSAAPNGFVNFFLKDSYIAEKLLEANKDFDSFTHSDVGEGKTILVEGPSANPNKPFHIGHLLNLFLTKSLLRLFDKAGFETVNDYIVNDKGLAVCKAIWGIKNLAQGATPESEGLKPDLFVGKYYMLASKQFKENPDVAEDIQKTLKAWESSDLEVIDLWKQMIKWALDGQIKTIERVGEEIGHLWYESDFYDKGRDLIKNYVDNEKIVETDDGALVAKLEEEYGVPDVVLLKSDGTTLYHTQDVLLTKMKIEKFHPWKAIWVVGNEQILHFQQLFSLLDMIGLLPIENLYHYAYGFIYGKDGKKMSSRNGEALSGDQLIDSMKEAAMKILESREENIDSKIDKEFVAEKVAIGALKFSFLVTDPFKDSRFDIERAVSYTGKSGPYIMYSYARGNNILKKSSLGNINNIESVKLSSIDKSLIIKALTYPEVLLSAANNYAPSILAEYLYDLAKSFNRMYESEEILKADSVEKYLRLEIVALVVKILQDGLTVLGIDVLEVM